VVTERFETAKRIGGAVTDGKDERLGAGAESLLDVAVHITGSARPGYASVRGQVDLIRTGGQFTDGERESIADRQAFCHGYSVAVADRELTRLAANSGPLICAALSIVLKRGNWRVCRAALAVAVPLMNRMPLTVTPCRLAPEPDRTNSGSRRLDCLSGA